MTAESSDTDPLLRHVELHRSITLPVLGIPVVFQSNDDVLHNIVIAAFGTWAELPIEQISSDTPPVRIRLIRHESGEITNDRQGFVFRMPDADRVFFHTDDSVGVADVARMDGVAYLGPKLRAKTALVRHDVIEMMTFVLITSLDRTPVHSTMFSTGSNALVVTGPTGVGKSTLAYHNHRRGIRVLSDDAAYVQTEPRLRVWGMPGPLRVPPDSVSFFPDLAGRPAVTLPNGKTKIPVHGFVCKETLVPHERGIGLCLLTRNGGGASLRPATVSEVEAAVRSELTISNDLYGERVQSVIARLVEAPTWCLNMASHPSSVDHLIDQMLADL